MATYTWLTAASNLWSTASAWSPASVPTAGSFIAISAIGSPYTVTLDSGTSASVSGLTLASQAATLAVVGTLALSGTAAITAGTLTVRGVVSGGTITDAGGLVGYGGTLTGVTVNGTIDLSGYSNSITVSNVTLNGSAGSGAGTILLTGTYSHLNMTSSGTLDNATVYFGANSGTDYLEAYATGITLTLGAKLAIVQTGSRAQFYGYSNDTFINKGKINASVAGGQLSINGGTFTNQGSITVANGETFDLGSVQSWSNTGSIQVSNATLQLGGAFAATQLAGVNATTGTVAIAGSLDNTGNTLSIGPGLKYGALALAGGTISNGVIAGNLMVATFGTLSNLTVRGTIDLSANSKSLTLSGVTLTGAGGTGAASVMLTGNNSTLFIASTTTLDNATLTIGNNSNWSDLYINGYGTTLTLGSHMNVVQAGTYAELQTYSGTTVNRGTITAGFAGGEFYVNYGTFTNQGAINVSNGATFDLGSVQAWSNTGTIQVSSATLRLGGAFTTAQVKALALNNATLAVTGTLDNTASTLSIGAGFRLGALVIAGGTVTNGVISGDIIGSGGTLSSVSVQGTLDLSSNASSLTLAGVTLSGAGGVGAGTILLTGGGSNLYLGATATLDNAVLDIGNNSSWDQLYVNAYGATLTLGSHLNILQTGSHWQLYSYYGATVLNKGTINAGIAGGQFAVNGGTFVNQGLITVSGGETFDLTSASAWSNTGTITLTNATLLLAGSLTTAQLAGIKGSASVIGIRDTLDNTGGTLSLGEFGNPGSISLSGTIANGVIVDTGGGLIGTGGTLSGVAWRGTLDLSPAGARLTLANVTLADVTGTGSATIYVTGTSDTLYVGASQTLDNATIDLGNKTSWDYFNVGASSVTLTLGHNLVIQQAGSYAGINASYYNDLLVNNGTILATVSGSRFVVNASTLTNNGLLGVLDGVTLDLGGSGAFTNVAGGTLSSGTLSVGSGATLELTQSTTISVDAASITLSGAGSVIQSYTGGNQVGLDATLATISAGGTLALLGGRSLTATANGGTFTDAGSLVLDGGALAAGSLALASGTINGAGTITGPVTVSGTSALTGAGGITVGGSIGGTGRLNVAAGQTLSLSAGTGIGCALYVYGQVQLTGGALANINMSATGGLTGYGLVVQAYGPGLLDANGGTLHPGYLQALSGGTLGSLALEADAGATLRLPDGAMLATDTGSLTFNGAGSAISTYQSGSGTFIQIESTLASVTASGTLAVAGGRVLTLTANSGTLTDAGLLSVSGGTLAARQIVLTAGAKLAGTGTINAAMALNGGVVVKSGTVSLGGTISGAGPLTVSAGAGLVLTQGGTVGGTLADAGLLQLAGANLAIGQLAVAAGAIASGRGVISGTIANSGLLDAIGGTLGVSGLAGLGAGTLSAGALEADANALLQLGGNVAITTLAGTITLNGAGSAIGGINAVSKALAPVDATLAAITATGTLSLLGGRSFTATANGGTLTDAGLLGIDAASAFKATSLSISATGMLFDSGSFSGALANAGTVYIDGGATLAPSGGGALGGTYTGPGTLLLAGATPFTLAPTVTLTPELVAVAAGATLSGTGTLSVPLDVAGNVVASGGTLALVGGLSDTGTLTAAAGAVLQLLDGGTFQGVVTGGGTVVNGDSVTGAAVGVSLAGAGTLDLVNRVGGELGGVKAAALAGGTALVNNAGGIAGTFIGLAVSGQSATIVNSGIISGGSGAAIKASASGGVTINNSGLILNHYGPGVAAIALNGASSAVVTDSGTIVGGGDLTRPGAAIQFGAGNDRLALLPGAVIIGTVRGGAGSNTLELAAGATVGTISGIGAGYQGFATLIEDGGAAWVAAGLDVMAAGGALTLAAGGALTVGGTLTAGGAATINGAGTLAVASGGTLLAGTGVLGVAGVALTNLGMIAVNAGASLTLAPATWTNLASGALSGGTYEVNGAGTLQLAANAGVTTDNAAIILNGAGGAIQWQTGAATTTLAQSLGTIGAAGSLAVQNGASYAASGTLVDQGTIALSNGAISVATLTVATSGAVIGAGTLGGNIADAGQIEAATGSLTLLGTVTGAGTIGIAADSVLYAAGKLSVGTVAFLDAGGTLSLAQPALFSGTLTGFAESDLIDVAGTITSVAFAGNTLTLNGAGGVVTKLQLAGDYSAYGFSTFADGHGGTGVVLI